MLQFRVYPDDQGRPRAEAAPPHQLLAWFLMHDLGADPVRARDLLALVDELMNGTRASADGQGRLYQLELTGDHARITDARIDPPDVCELSIGGFRFALDQWLQLLV